MKNVLAKKKKALMHCFLSLSLGLFVLTIGISRCRDFPVPHRIYPAFISLEIITELLLL